MSKAESSPEVNVEIIDGIPPNGKHYKKMPFNEAAIQCGHRSDDGLCLKPGFGAKIGPCDPQRISMGYCNPYISK